MRDVEIYLQSKKLLNELEIMPSYKGYEHLISAIYHYINRKEEFDFNMNEDIYKKVAEDTKSTATRVERTIRTVIHLNEKSIKNYFNIKHKPTNKLALVLIGNKIKELSNGKLLNSKN